MQGRNSRTGFERSAKRRQQQFRDVSPTVSDRGRSPTDDKGLRNPHLLAIGRETDNLFPGIRGEGGAVDFFKQRGIKWWKSSRSGDDSKSDGPTRNMASSQVACVNFLLPLAGIPGALLSALRALDDDVVGVIAITHDGCASDVEFEWIGLGHSLEGGRTRGSQNTSIDAFLVAVTTAGRRRAYLLEWKYVEQYLSSDPEFKGDGSQGVTRRLRYAERYHSPFSSFNPATVPVLDDFLYEPFYQIMRQRLLARPHGRGRRVGSRRGQGSGGRPGGELGLSDRHRWQDNHFPFVGSTISPTGDCGGRDAGLSEGSGRAVRHGGSILLT